MFVGRRGPLPRFQLLVSGSPGDRSAHCVQCGHQLAVPPVQLQLRAPACRPQALGLHAVEVGKLATVLGDVQKLHLSGLRDDASGAHQRPDEHRLRKETPSGEALPCAAICRVPRAGSPLSQSLALGVQAEEGHRLQDAEMQGLLHPLRQWRAFRKLPRPHVDHAAGGDRPILCVDPVAWDNHEVVRTALAAARGAITMQNLDVNRAVRTEAGKELDCVLTCPQISPLHLQPGLPRLLRLLVRGSQRRIHSAIPLL
mmetsp:Transcript_47368/g.144097  ORF Transcript_47368/g.144097 Transcript_47368/m.144097 type:complete len:256 (+) Transcript_47368:1338-2105(+)